MKAFKISAALVCVQLSPLASANPIEMIPELTNVFDYDYVQATVTSYDAGGNGLTVAVSKDLRSNVNAEATFSNASDYIAMSGRVGYHYELENVSRTDARFFAGLERAEFNAGAGTQDTSESGVLVGAGLRSSASETLELTGEIAYHSLWDGDLSLMGGVRLQLNQQFDLIFDYTIADNDFFNLGARMYF